MAKLKVLYGELNEQTLAAQAEALQKAGQFLVAAAQIKDEGARLIFLQSQCEEICEEGLAAAGAPGKKRVGHIIAGAAAAILNPLMQVEIERRSICGFYDGQGLTIEKRVPAVAFMQSEKE